MITQADLFSQSQEGAIMRHLLSADSRRGFTLFEIMVTVLILGILMAIAIPNLLNSRNSANTKTCLTNLRHIEQAKEQYATDEKKRDGDAVTWSDLVPGLLKSKPVCQGGGTYNINALGSDPECSVTGHVLP